MTFLWYLDQFGDGGKGEFSLLEGVLFILLQKTPTYLERLSPSSASLNPHGDDGLKGMGSVAGGKRNREEVWGSYDDGEGRRDTRRRDTRGTLREGKGEMELVSQEGAGDPEEA